jgi:hypothetical protein
MSTEFHPSNPFRRKATTRSTPVEDPVFHSYDASPQQAFPFPTSQTSAIDQIRVQTKPVKKVRVQSPPPSSPEADSIPQSLPTPISRPGDFTSIDNDPFENATTDSSEDSGDETETLKSTSVPANPFQKTMATLERTDGGESSIMPVHASTSGGTSLGRASLDVEAFKRLLMTGSADAAAPASSLAPPINIGQLALNDGGSSTDASSSASRQSIFEPIQEIHPESPRTSHEVSDPDDERRRLATDGLASSERRKPPPPSSRHGKLIKVELKDDAAPRVDTSLLPGWKGPQQSSMNPLSAQSVWSPTDLNKPLPAAPTRASHESDRESIFDREAAGKTPEPASPSSTQTRKTPPAPPLTRRHSQLVSESKATRPTSVRLPTNAEEGSKSSSYEHILSQSTAKAPPPPPTRRPASVRNISQADSIPSSGTSQEQQRPRSKSGSVPTPPPARTASTRQSSRPPSVMSMDLTGKRGSTGPPPPPPPRQRASSRTSMEGPVLSSASSRRASSDYYRRSIDSTREESFAPPANHEVLSEGNSGANDILADLTALQREVDALRGQYEMRGTG